MELYHVTTPKKAKRYRESGYIKSPVRGFTTIMGAMAWAIKTGRTVIYQVKGERAYKLPDHHKMNKQDAIKCLKSIQQWVPDFDDREDGLSYWDAIDMGIDALDPPNEPLTLAELREMDGQPVWIKRLKGLSVCDIGWALMDTCTDRIRVWWPGSEVEDTPSEEDYGKTWAAYGHPSKED